MCYCDPNVRTPFCGSQVCIEAAQRASGFWKEDFTCCERILNQYWNHNYTQFVCWFCGKKYKIEKEK